MKNFACTTAAKRFTLSDGVQPQGFQEGACSEQACGFGALHLRVHSGAGRYAPAHCKALRRAVAAAMGTHGWDTDGKPPPQALARGGGEGYRNPGNQRLVRLTPAARVPARAQGEKGGWRYTSRSPCAAC